MKERNEQTENENGKEKKKQKSVDGEKKFYLYTAIACATALLAIVITAVAVTNTNAVDNQGGVSSGTSDTTLDSSGGTTDDKPVVVVPEGMVLPVLSASAENDYGFYYNQTVGAYYLHTGIDFVASVGTEVLASEDGVVESIYKDDLLLGTEIVLDHGDGLKTVYRFVTEADGLKVGTEVKKGDVIGSVAEANGNEYKEGAHLHFEIMKNGESVDPTEYLTLEEK